MRFLHLKRALADLYIQGKPVYSTHRDFLAPTRRNTKTELLKQFADFIKFESAPQATPAPGVAQDLIERAEANAGRNPSEAEDLRAAARAFLSVIR